MVNFSFFKLIVII